jgi:hypothetical protein
MLQKKSDPPIIDLKSFDFPKNELIASHFCATLGLFLIVVNCLVNLDFHNFQNNAALMVLTTGYLCLMLNYANWQW